MFKSSLCVLVGNTLLPCLLLTLLTHAFSTDKPTPETEHEPKKTYPEQMIPTMPTKQKAAPQNDPIPASEIKKVLSELGNNENLKTDQFPKSLDSQKDLDRTENRPKLQKSVSGAIKLPPVLNKNHQLSEDKNTPNQSLLNKVGGAKSNSSSSEIEKELNRTRTSPKDARHFHFKDTESSQESNSKDEKIAKELLDKTTVKPKEDHKSELSKERNRPQASGMAVSKPFPTRLETTETPAVRAQSTPAVLLNSDRGEKLLVNKPLDIEYDARSKNRPFHRVKHRRRKLRNRDRKRPKNKIKKPKIEVPKVCPTQSKYEELKRKYEEEVNRKSQPVKDCSECGAKNDMDEGKVKEGKIKQFVQVMVDKLRVRPVDLIKPPSAKRRDVKYPQEVINEAMKDQDRDRSTDEFYARDEKIFIPGQDLGRFCIAKRTSGCYKFRMAGKIDFSLQITSATLYVYKTPDLKDSAITPHTFILYGLEKLRSGRLLASNQQIQRHDTFVRKGWVAINVTRAMNNWVIQKKKVELVAVRCSTCATRNHKALYGTKDGYKPILVVEYDRRSSVFRRRRSHDHGNCNPDVECCKRRLTLNFSDLQMPSIQAPSELSVGYCFGFCGGSNRHVYNHTMFKQRVRLVSNASTYMRNQLKSCCVPVVLKGTHLFVRMDGVAKKTYLPHVIVDTCGCV